MLNIIEKFKEMMNEFEMRLEEFLNINILFNTPHLLVML